MSRSLVVVVALAFSLLFAHSQVQSPDITGVWKADLQKSKIAGPPISDYLVVIEQKIVEIDHKTGEKGPEIDELTGTKTQRGESRSLLAFLPFGKPAIRLY